MSFTPTTSGRAVEPVSPPTSSPATTEAVVNRHLQRFSAGDLPGVVADYAPNAVFIVPSGVLRGVAAIEPLFAALIAEFAKPGAIFDLQQQVVEGDVAYIRWVAETADNTYDLGTDTFVVRDSKILIQTFAFKATPKR
jgi:ketosteroid isomerase-like protein